MKIISCLNKNEIIDFDYSCSYLRDHEQKDNHQSNFRIFINLISFTIKQIIKDLYCLLKNESVKDKILLYYSSVNQLNALTPIKNHLNNSTLTGPYHLANNRLPMAIGCLLSFIYLPHFYSIANNKSSEKKLLHSGSYFLIEGMYKWWIWYLKYKKPKAIIFSNDHLVWHRVLRKAAQINKIPAIYIQHASVTEKFPKLEFDLSLLEGQDALDKYSKKRVNGEVALIGMPKFDKYFPYINMNNSIETIGICTNTLDDVSNIEKLCSILRTSFPTMKIIIRPHPRDPRKQLYQTLIENYKLDFSDSKKENSFEFLTKVDANIAGESSVHLEAALMNVYPIHYKLNNKYFDHYSYIKNGLIQNKFEAPNDLVNFILSIKRNKPNIRNRVKNYVDTVNTQYDGKSTQKAVEIINKFVNTY